MTAIVRHPHFDVALRGAIELLRDTLPGRIARCCGLTGSGKSELMILAAQSVFLEPKLWEEGRVPIAFVRAIRSRGGRFNSKYFAKCCWRAVQNPDLGWRQPGEAGHADAREARLLEAEQSALYRAATYFKDEEDIRDAFVEIAIARRLKVLVVEDAHSMTATMRHVNPADFVQPWMAIAERIGLIIVFVGTPSLLKLWDPQEEAHRRSRTLYVARYEMATQQERKDFATLIKGVAMAFEWEPGYSPVRDGALISQQTLGIFGQVLAFFERAKLRASEQGRAFISAADLRNASMNARELRTLVEHVLAFDLAKRPVTFDEADEVYSEVKRAMLLVQARP